MPAAPSAPRVGGCGLCSDYVHVIMTKISSSSSSGLSRDINVYLHAGALRCYFVANLVEFISPVASFRIWNQQNIVLQNVPEGAMSPIYYI